MSGFISIILNAHLPFVREPTRNYFLEEKWLFEAITETYLPLLECAEKFYNHSSKLRLTISLSPTLMAMLDDPILRKRYVEYLHRQIAFAESETQRIKGNSSLDKIVAFYSHRYKSAFELFEKKHQRDLISAFRFYREAGLFEIMVSAGTHCFMPLYSDLPGIIFAQVEMAVTSYINAFGEPPKGFWLPECAYYEGVEEVLRRGGLQYFILSSHGVGYADPPPDRGVFAPIFCPNGLAAFPRDRESVDSIWSSRDGYPCRSEYRDFYSDVGFELPSDYVMPFMPEGKIAETGFKYWINNTSQGKKIYDPEVGLKCAQSDARSYLHDRINHINRISPHIDLPPLLTIPFDIELFGHWWVEGITFLETFFSEAISEESVELITPSDYLELSHKLQTLEPVYSSWGKRGYSQVWLDGSNDWINRHVHRVILRMHEITTRFPVAETPQKRILDQAAREVLLATASDWPFFIRTKTNAAYAAQRVEEHITNFNLLYNYLCSGKIDSYKFMEIEKKNNIFPFMDYAVFR